MRVRVSRSAAPTFRPNAKARQISCHLSVQQTPFHPEARAEFLADIDWFEERRPGYWRDRVSR
jgi:hypothetical protein